MPQQLKLQSAQATYCLDACAVLDFWGSDDIMRRYDVSVRKFREIWDHIAKSVEDGRVTIPSAIYEKLVRTTKTELKTWLQGVKELMWDHDDAMSELTSIVNRFDTFTKTSSDLTDAILVAVAKRHSLTVVTSERYQTSIGSTNPHIPNVCEVVGVPWMNLPQYFQAEGL